MKILNHIELPEGWTTTRERTGTGMKLDAEYVHPDTGAIVRVGPYKTYDHIPGFPDAHSVTIEHPDGASRTRRGLPDLESSADAKQVAVEMMQSFNLCCGGA